MELEQIIKRLDWLDNERRKDATTISSLREQVSGQEGLITQLNQQIRDLTSEVARLSTTLNRFDQMDNAIAMQRVDLTRMIEAAEKQRADRERELDVIRRGDLESFNKAVAELRKGLEPIPDIKKNVQARIEEELRLSKMISELTVKMNESRRQEEDYQRAQRLLDEAQRQSSKRLVDMQGELSSLRKRVDEQRGKIDLNSDSVRKLEVRFSEIQASENERRQTVTAFIEKQSLAQVERDRTWKEWQTRFDTIEKTRFNLDDQLQALDSTQRSIKRSQDVLDEVTQRFERRINEITEMQRLVEDRFRQEWVAFKADDQKRWTNYSLAHEEQQRESTRQFDKLSERLTPIEDVIQEMQENLRLANEETRRQLQSLLAFSQQMLENYDRNMGK